jgi:hypothetical protein
MTKLTMATLSKVLGLLVLTLAAGCTVPLYNVKPTLNKSSIPPVNEMSEVAVGESMLTYTNRIEVDAIRFKEEVTIGPIRNFRFSPGFLIKHGEDEKSEFYMRVSLPGATQIKTNPLSQPFASIQLEEGESGVCAVMVNGGRFCKDDVQYERFTYIARPKEAEQKRLVYLGWLGDAVSLQYQEYIGSSPAPSHVEDVEFYLDGVSSIEFRNAYLEIFSADAESISYVVRHGFTNLEDEPVSAPGSE